MPELQYELRSHFKEIDLKAAFCMRVSYWIKQKNWSLTERSIIMAIVKRFVCFCFFLNREFI